MEWKRSREEEEKGAKHKKEEKKRTFLEREGGVTFLLTILSTLRMFFSTVKHRELSLPHKPTYIIFIFIYVHILSI